ncbi:hypothetical protein ES705_29684 [subsurface metagenome]
MKKNTIIFLSAIFCFLKLSAEEPKSPGLKGFYVGITKEEVKILYEKFKTNAVAQYIDIETEAYRDQIKLDNEFSSMGNKIDIMYDEEGKATSITFQYKTVDILFNAAQMSAEELVKKLQEKLQIPEMKFQDMGMVKSWSHTYEEVKVKLSVDNNKNIRLQALKE